MASSLPEEMQNKFDKLRPQIQSRFEKRFDRREAISAESEARRLVAALLLEGSSTTLKLRPLLSETTRLSSVKEVLRARLREEDARVQLEQRLIEIGYGEGSALSQKWSTFRQKNSQKLAIILKFAKNSASTVFLGVPLFLQSSPPRNFAVPRDQHRGWSGLRQEFISKIDRAESPLMRQLKVEAAFDFTSRIAAIAILALITDELLSLAPKWRALKAKALDKITFGHSGMESHIELERMAFENWKDVVEAFTGSRPSDDSNEAHEMRARVRATTREDLWIHIHQQGPLNEAPAPSEQDAPWMPATTDEAAQMFLTPMFVR